MLTCAIPFVPPSPTNLPSFRNLHSQNRLRTKNIAYNNLKPIHARTKSTLFYFNLYLRLYVNAGAMHDAQKLFDEMPERTLVSWTILMSGYARNGPAFEALVMFRSMLFDCNGGLFLPDSFVFSVVLRACAEVGSLRYGRGIHGQLLKRNGVMDSFVENALVNMYTSCGCLVDAAAVFGGIEKPDLVAWSSMLSGYVKNGYEEEGLKLFLYMIREGVEPDTFILSTVIGACRNWDCLDFGIQVHCNTIKMGFGSCLFLENSVMDFYAKCGDLEGMRRIFSMMSVKNLVSWNTFITGYVHNSYHFEALRVFQVLIDEVNQCDDITLTSILEAITSLGNMEYGRELHGYIIRMGFESNHRVISSLLDMYIECVDCESLNLRKEVPLKVFNHLGGESDEYMIASMLKWCSLQLDLEAGMAFHSLIIKLDMVSDPYILSSLIDMYSNCGILEVAQRVFARAEDPGRATWSALISGYSYNDCFTEALKLFRKMQLNSIEANEFIFTSVLLACLALGNLRMGRELHCKILRSGYESNASVINMLINLYSELWHHKQALKLRSLIPDAEIAWKFLIKACLKAKDYEMIHKILRWIQISCGSLDQKSASDIFSSCSCPVLLNVGTQAQAYMTKRGLMSHPTISNSLIKMYSACGDIVDAVLAFTLMPDKNHLSWSSIVSARVDHGHPSEALDLFTKNGWKSKSTYSSTLTSVLKACAQIGRIDDAYRLFISMEEVYGVEPSEEHYSCMVEVLGRARMFEEAQEFINRIPPTKLGPLIWRSLLSSCRIHGNMKLGKYSVEKLLELEPNDFSANLLLEQLLLTSGEWDEASER